MASTSSSVEAAESQLSMSWQFQGRGDWPVLKRSIKRAQQMGATRVQLSHHLLMKAEELWTKGYQELANLAISYAHKKRLAVDVWTHEISGTETAERQNWNSWTDVDGWLKAKYARVFKLIPGCDGLIFTLAETEIPIYTDKAQDLCPVIAQETPVERMKHLILTMAEICRSFRKLLIVRTFVYEPRETKEMLKAIKLVRQLLPVGQNVVIMSKCVPHDWTPYYPYYHHLGRFEGFEEWVEIDLGDEYTGQSKIPHAQVDYIRSVVNHALSRNIQHVVARVERFENSALGTPNEVNLFALSELLKNPGLGSEEIWASWATNRYGVNASTYVVSALANTYEAVNLMYFPLEQWVTNHSLPPDYAYAISSIESRQNYKWTERYQCQINYEHLAHPTAETLERINHEKNRAAELIKASLQHIEDGRAYLEEVDYNELKGHFELLLKLIEVFRYHQLAIFGTLLCKQWRQQGKDCSAISSIVLEYLSHLEKMNCPDLQSHFSSIHPRPPFSSIYQKPPSPPSDYILLCVQNVMKELQTSA